MKKIHNYIMLFMLAFVAVCCSEEDIDTPSTSAKSGDEVQFSLSLDNGSRTVYGDEDETNSVFPIYWVEDDKVQIFSPHAQTGRRNAEYQVVLPDGVTNPNYAKELTKTGEYGVQWGTGYTSIDEDGNKLTGLHDFYSLYPSGEYTLSSDGTKAENITISDVQHIGVNGSVVKSDMEDCLMYAKKTGVAIGTIVELQYTPISTVLWVTLNTGASSDANVDTWTIQSISVTAQDADGEVVNIAGKFSLNVVDGSFGEFSEGKNTVQAMIVDSSTGAYLTMSNDGTLSIPLFIAPVSGLNVQNWKIQVVANNNTYTKTLGIDKTLEPGQIHKITLPTLTEDAAEWEVANWMKNIPRNVYLSEISIPGSWNSLNPEFQGTSPTISGQYTNGVRAFHLDTRWQGGGSAWEPTVDNVLGVANGGNTVEYEDGARVMTDSDNPSVESALGEIIENIKSDEYMILMCTFAQGSYNHSYTSENVTYDWVGEISRICSGLDGVYDAKNLTDDTLVGDVLGKVIVIVNMEGAISALPSDSKCLFINSPLTLTSNLFGSSLSDVNKTNIIKGTTNATTTSDTGIDIYNTQAQVCIAGETYTESRDRSNVDGRGFAPTFGERKTVANNILNWSKTNYGTENYAHDKWIYLGLGGYYVSYSSGFIGIGAGWKATDTGHEDVASDLNAWINTKVTEMGTTPTGQTTVVPYYPVGIVLMNYVNSYTSTVKNILLLNNKYRLQYDSTKPVDYDPNYKNPNDYDGTGSEGGDLGL